VSDRLRVAFGADDDNPCVAAVREYLEWRGTLLAIAPDEPWPEMARAVGEQVAEARADFGVVMCWTGTGTAIAANKVRGVRAAQASEPWIAANARRWNDANVLALSLKRLAPDVAVECVAAFLDTELDPGEAENIALLKQIDETHP
jgi:ribose 5-phosphate isomerase B